MKTVSALPLLLAASTCLAGEAEVVAARAHPQSDGSWRVEVTVRHADTGWDHYADRWEVLDERGELLGTRTLYHPHVDEQPFTRSLSGLRIPAGSTHITLRAHDSVHGLGGRTLSIELPR